MLIMRKLLYGFCAQGHFGRFDHVLHFFCGVSTNWTSGVAQQLKMHDFNEGGAASCRRRMGRSCAKRERRAIFPCCRKWSTGQLCNRRWRCARTRAFKLVETFSKQQEYCAFKREQASQQQIDK
eukprot:6179260-Pleurochrysis_carterae.AAC.1